MSVSSKLRLLALLCLLLSACSEPQQRGQLERIRDSGELRVVTRYSPATYYMGPDGPTGLEYELARGFAEHLGVELKMIVALGAGDIPGMLRHGRADMAAAGLAITERQRKQLRFGPPYQAIRPQVAYRRGTNKPDTIAEIDGRLGVVADTALEEQLQTLHRDNPQLEWLAYNNKCQQELLEMVAAGELDFAVVNANELGYARRYYAEVAAAMHLGAPLDVAWAFDSEADPALLKAVRDYFQRLREDGVIAKLQQRFHEHVQQHDYVDARTFLKRIIDRLPEYKSYFKSAAQQQDFDWRLLAALSYQESHWEPDARSPTGVRGMMMLTRDTAKRVGIEDRTDPVQSIQGGARYLREVIGKIPERIPYPDRLWLALAAYNIGFGHLEDARKLTESQGGDPDSWQDVSKRLPLLSQKQWYEQTRHGYARGHEPVQYVRNIRRYYNVLLWLDSQGSSSLKLSMPQIHPQAL